MNKQDAEDLLDKTIGCLIERLDDKKNIYNIRTESHNDEDCLCRIIFFDYCDKEKVLDAGIAIKIDRLITGEYGYLDMTPIMHNDIPLYNNINELKLKMEEDVESIMRSIKIPKKH